MIQVQEIGPVKILFGRHPFYPYCNTLLVKDHRTLLADPACEEKALHALRSRERIDILFNSHYHPDHIRYNTYFEAADLWVPREDAPCFRSLDSMAEWVGVRGTEFEKTWKASLRKVFLFQEREPSKEVEDGTTLHLGGVTIQFLHFPGHTPGLTGFLIPEIGLLFTADMELSPAGPWYGNKRADIQSIVDSVEKIRRIPAQYYLPSHGPKISSKEIGPRLDRYLENIHSRERRILEALSAPHTLDELTGLSLISGFRLPRRQIWFFFERSMVGKHLDRLIARGRVSFRGEKYQRED